MPRIAFTDLSIKALKPELRTDYWDTKTPGFGLRVGKNSKTFFVKRDNRRITIGRFPDWTLQEARAEAKRLLLQKSSSTRITVAGALDLFVSDHLKTKNRLSTAKEHERILRKHLQPIFEKRMADVSKADILALIRQINRTPSAANHLFVVARIFFRWSVRNDHIEHSPLASLTLPHRRSKRSRVLTDEELYAMYKAALNDGGTFSKIVLLLLHTGQRRGEIASLQSSWFNEKENTITLPSEITKNGREHTFPIGSVCLSFVSSQLPKDRKLLFPARGKTDVPFNGWSKSKVAFDRMHSVTNWTLHDLRRTFRTIHARIGTPPHIAERLLNHIQPGLIETYDRHAYLPEMRAAMLAYEAELMRVLDPDSATQHAA
ncbi:MAG: site-specific integrase [Xanthobacteraceae bacterium]